MSRIHGQADFGQRAEGSGDSEGVVMEISVASGWYISKDIPATRARCSWRAEGPRYEGNWMRTWKKGTLRYRDWSECFEACADSYSNNFGNVSSD